MTTDRNPIDDEPLPGGLYDDEYPAADDDGTAICETCGLDFEPTASHAPFHCDDCYYEALML